MLPEAKILLAGHFTEENIIINFTENSNRKVNPEIESRLPQIWEENFRTAKEAGKLIFDGESFRLEDFKVVNGNLEITVSKFKYSMRSSLVTLAPELYEYGMDYTANGLAIGGFVRTSDGKYIFGEKSGKTTSKVKVDFIGGMLETDSLNSGKDLILVNKNELKEEINIDSQDIKSIVVLGIIYTPSTQVIILTSTELNLTSEEVLKKFSMENDGEMSGLVFKTTDELPEYVKEIGSYKPQALELLNI